MQKRRSIPAYLFGEFQWAPPFWLRGLGRIARRRRRAAAGAAVLIAAVAGGGIWWVRQPKPVAVDAVAIAPGVTPIAKELVPQPLRIRFSEPVRPLRDAPAGAGVRMEPPIPGKWSWESDAALRFDPERDWPASTKYRVTFEPDAVAAHVRLSSRRVDWRTPDFSAKITEIAFYQDPRDPEVKQVVATVEFSHGVEAQAVAKHAEFLMLGRNTREAFDVTFDAHRRRAYLRTKPIVLPEREDFVKLTVAPGIRTVQGGAATGSAAEAKARVPDVYSFFRFTGATAGIAWTDNGEPEQIVALSSACAAESGEIAKFLSIRLLPAKAGDDPRWGGPSDVTKDALAAGRELKFEAVPSAAPQGKEHAFRVRVPEDGQLYVEVGRGARAPGGFVLGDEYAAVVDVPKPAKSVAFEGDGAVLALAGERKLSVRSRGIPAIEYEVARVETSQINHLVSQTGGDFGNPRFRNWAFDESNISRIAAERSFLADASPFVEESSAFDVAPHLARPGDGGGGRGLFFLTACGWDPRKNCRIDGARDARFLLVTDLGLIAKADADGGREVFVASIRTGRPLPKVAVRVVGRNGLPVAGGTTDGDGKVTFAPMRNPERDREPVAIVAELGDDLSFLPYERRDRGIDYSRFDVGGDRVRDGSELDAFLFTERGVYRPGDSVHVGYIVKRRDWVSPPAGLPLEIEATDARGRVVATRRIVVPEAGFGEFAFRTEPSSSTGLYRVSLYLVRDRERVRMLGSATPRVKEFLPDRMKVSARIEPDAGRGWISPRDVKASVSLQNLYGTPASGRKVSARLELAPDGFSFDAYPGYRFDDPIRRDWTAKDLRSVVLPDTTTDARGESAFGLNLERFAPATYAMTLSIEGFEGGGGRSVGLQRTFLVSPLDRVVGCKTDGDLRYLPAGRPRQVRFLAVDRSVKPCGMERLSFRVVQRVFLSVLRRQPNGNYAYESVEQKREIRSETLDLPAAGLSFDLPTDAPGSFVLEVRDAAGAKVNGVEFCVVGKGDGSRRLERNAELEMRLPAREFRAGDDIEVAVTAPYAGSGLITLERDRVYAQSWFVSDAASSVQRLHIPEGFEGTGYVNVTFVRGLDSKEIFTSPMSVAVEPVTVNREARRVGIALSAAAESKPGEPLAIRYRASKPSKIVLFAVDEGILRVTDYRRPRPLEHFFRQSALMVETSQILDLILPEFSILRSASASGGDGDLIARNLNPFRRVTEKPVVFWSGILDAGEAERVVTYDVPDYFDGTLRIMAVAYSPEGAGSAECSSLVRGRFVLAPSVPTAVAPGDEFSVAVTVSNGGEAAELSLSAEPNGNLEILGGAEANLRLGRGEEAIRRFRVRAKDRLGSGELVFTARGDGESARRRATTSVRPAVPYRTSVRSAHFDGKTCELPCGERLRPEFRKAEATLSPLPLGLAKGLQRYLDEYPFGCSEQIASAAFCRLVLAGEADFGLDRSDVSDQLEHVFGVLRQRQNDQGAFGYWQAGGTPPLDFLSLYVSQFLIEAKDSGFPPPDDMLARTMRRLGRMANEAEPATLDEARLRAWAIYLLTREGVVTTNAILNLRDTLRRIPGWEHDLTAAYLAGSLKMLRQDGEAEKLAAGCRLGLVGDGAFSDGLAMDARLVAILTRHFPERLRKMGAGEFRKILDPIAEGRFSTQSAAWAVAALKSYSGTVGQTGARLEISAADAGGMAAPLAEGEGRMVRAEFAPEAETLRFSAGKSPLGAFCQVSESGYSAALPAAAESNGIEVWRRVPAAAKVGEPVAVTLRVRALGTRTIDNVAIVDLLPGGFEASLPPGSLPGWDHADVREDRVVVFGSVGPRFREIRYTIKPTCMGSFVVPPLFAEAMYDRGTNGRSAAGSIEISDR